MYVENIYDYNKYDYSQVCLLVFTEFHFEFITYMLTKEYESHFF